MEAYERFDASFVEISDRNDVFDNKDVDPFTVAQSVGTIFRVIAGDTSAIEEIVKDPVFGGTPEFQEESGAAINTLVSDVRSIGCELEPAQIILKGISGAIQRVIIEEAAADTDFDSAFPTAPSFADELGDDVSDEFKANARRLDELTARINATSARRPLHETPEQREQRLSLLLRHAEEATAGARELIDIVKRDTANEMEQARLSYIQSQGWDPDNLDFSQRLDTKMHLKSLGYRVS